LAESSAAAEKKSPHTQQNLQQVNGPRVSTDDKDRKRKSEGQAGIYVPSRKKAKTAKK
jgi:hypothetical protein